MTNPEFELPEIERRGYPWVWIIVGLLLAFMCVASLIAMGAGPSDLYTKDAQALRKEISRLEEFAKTPEALAQGPAQSQDLLQRAQEVLGPLKLKTKGAQATRARVMLILTKNVQPGAIPDFSGINESTDDITDSETALEVRDARAKVDSALRQVYTSSRLTSERAAALKNIIVAQTGGVFPYTLVLKRIDALSGRDAQSSRVKLVVGIVVILGLICGVGAWIAYFILKSSGAKALGIPLANKPKWIGDALGLRFLYYILIFAGVSTIVPSLPLGRNQPLYQLLTVAVTLGVCIAMLRSRVGGVSLSAWDIGWRSKNIGKDILWGIGGWLANWPVILVLAWLGDKLFKWIPSGEHPLERQLLAPDAVWPALLFAAILAPILEETFFRGCLFQGVTLRLRSVPWGVILSSLAFGSIHPQGGASWLPLAWIGAMGCLLAYERRSLVPSIVMHALHNATLIVIGSILL